MKREATRMDLEERRAIEAVLRRFAARVDRVLFSIEGPDGDLARVPQLLTKARKLDLVADPVPGAPGHELGVWGRHCQGEGLARSLLALSLLGEACAGFATAVHAQGLACLALSRHNSSAVDGQSRFPPAALVAAAFVPHYGIPLSARLQPEGSGLRLAHVANGLRLDGASYFLLAAGAPQVLICFAPKAGGDGSRPEWISLLLDAGTAGVELEVLAHRTGLRAACQYHLHCDGVAVSREQVLCSGDAAWRSLVQVLACDWLGQAAIALGVARRALRDSRAYTAQRYQGGCIIEDHAGIQLLQGTAEYGVALLEAILDRHAAEPLSTLDPEALLRWAVTARLAVVEHAHRAVTDCLQTLGGYGYMEDYGFEKRLRDVSTLKGLHGAPDQLKLFLNELVRGR